MNSTRSQSRPELSLVMPCYNEEESIRYTMTKLLSAFEKAGYQLELIAVDNGSLDRTGGVIKELAAENPSVVYHRVDNNEGYGNGVLSGLPLCTALWVGIIPADGPVTAQDVVGLFEIVANARTPKLFKVRRRFRMEGIFRRVVSVSYNLFTRMLFGNLNTTDLNASPKILPRKYIERMNLQSKDWFLDAEIMIKARRMGLSVFEMNVFAIMRAEGTSHIRPSTCWEFVTNLLSYRFGTKRQHLCVDPLEPAEHEEKSTSNIRYTGSR